MNLFCYSTARISLHINFLHNLPLGEYALDKIRCTGNVNAGTPRLWDAGD